jgi:hypothetical protein
VLQIAEGVRLWNTKVAALISRAQEDREINAEEDPHLLAALYINCWQGAMIRAKCDPSAQEDCLRFALDRLLGASGDAREGNGLTGRLFFVLWLTLIFLILGVILGVLGIVLVLTAWRASSIR